MSSIQNIATALAADLADARVDPNEAQKALAYLRSKRDGKQFFDYLRAINRNGRVVIRSGQTLGYYRDLLAACERHLRGMDAVKMAQTLGWAIRLLRYYRAVPSAPRPSSTTSQRERQQIAQAQQPAMHGSKSTASTVVSTEPSVPSHATKPQLPTVGDIFTGAVLASDESAVVVAVPGFDERAAIGIIKAEILGGRTDRYRVGNAARVEVTNTRQLKNGRTVLELKPAPKKRDEENRR